MTSVTEIRRAMAAGVAFVILFVVGVFEFFGNAPSIHKHESDAVAAAKYVAKLSSSGHRTGLLVAAYLFILAGLAFVWFALGLQARLTSTMAGRFVSALGVLGAAAMAAAAMAIAGVAGAVTFGHQPVPQDGDTMRVVMDLAFPFLFVVFGLVAAALIATIAVAGRGSGFAGWQVNLAWLGALGALLGVIFLPMVLALLWFLAIAVSGTTSPAGSSPEPASTD